MTSREYAQLLFDTINDNPEKDQEKIIGNFKNLLVKRKEIHLSTSILKEFAKITQESEVENTAYVASASELSSSQKKMLEKELGTKVQFSVNENLLGGVAIRQKDILHNVTLRRRLEALKSSL